MSALWIVPIIKTPGATSVPCAKELEVETKRLNAKPTRITVFIKSNTRLPAVNGNVALENEFRKLRSFHLDHGCATRAQELF